VFFPPAPSSPFRSFPWLFRVLTPPVFCSWSPSLSLFSFVLSVFFFRVLPLSFFFLFAFSSFSFLGFSSGFFLSLGLYSALPFIRPRELAPKPVLPLQDCYPSTNGIVGRERGHDWVGFAADFPASLLNRDEEDA